MREAKRYLEDRIVHCANCDGNRMLMSCPSGLVCSACASANWMYLPTGITPRWRASSTVLPVVTDQVKEGLQNMGHALMQKVVELSSPGLAPIMAR